MWRSSSWINSVQRCTQISPLFHTQIRDVFFRWSPMASVPSINSCYALFFVFLFPQLEQVCTVSHFEFSLLPRQTRPKQKGSFRGDSGPQKGINNKSFNFRKSFTLSLSLSFSPSVEGCCFSVVLVVDLGSEWIRRHQMHSNDAQHSLSNIIFAEIARDCIFNVFLLWSISKLVNVKPHFSGGKTRVLWNRWSTVVVFQKSRFRFMIIFSHACFLTSSSESRGSTSSPLRVSLDLFEAKPNQV